MRSTLRRVSALSLLSLTIVACSDGGSGPAGPAKGGQDEGGIRVTGVTMTYSGAVNGSFATSGDPTPDANGDLAFADYAVLVPGSPGAIVTALDTNGSEGDAIMLILGNVAVGEYPIGPACAEDGNTNCVIGVFKRGFTALEDSNFGGGFQIVSGTLKVTRSTDEGVEGSFSGTAVRDGAEHETIQVKDGAFGLKYLYR